MHARFELLAASLAHHHIASALRILRFAADHQGAGMRAKLLEACAYTSDALPTVSDDEISSVIAGKGGDEAVRALMLGEDIAPPPAPTAAEARDLARENALLTRALASLSERLSSLEHAATDPAPATVKI